MTDPPTDARLAKLVARTYTILTHSTEGVLSRRQIDRTLRTVGGEMSAVRTQMTDAGLITIEKWPTGGRPQEAWRLKDYWYWHHRGLESPQQLGDRQVRRRRIAAQFPRPTDRTPEQAERVWSA